MDGELKRGNRRTRPTSPQTVPRLVRSYDGGTAAARVRAAAIADSDQRSTTLVVSSVLQPCAALGEPLATAPSVACISLRLKPGEQLLCCSHALHSWHSLLWLRLPQL